MNVGSVTPYETVGLASTVAEIDKTQKAFVAMPSEPIVSLMPSASLRAKDE